MSLLKGTKNKCFNQAFSSQAVTDQQELDRKKILNNSFNIEKKY
jgi:hypothetical protein